MDVGDTNGVQQGMSMPQTGEDGSDMQRMAAEQQERCLVPLKEDLAEWMAKLLGIEIGVDNFMDVLDNGVHICRLANLIHARAVECKQGGDVAGNVKVPSNRVKFRQNVQSGTWFARDNTANFLQWCADYGIKVECMFETDDLVLHKQERSVVLCLLELARVAYKFGIEPPALIRLEKEIENEMQSGDADDIIPNLREKPVIIKDRTIKDPIVTEDCGITDLVIKDCVITERKGSGDSLMSSGMSEVMQQSPRKTRSQSVDNGTPTRRRIVSAPPIGSRCPPSPAKPRQSQLDKEVKKLSSKCKCCQPFEIQRLREGTYNIGGKVVFIRLLKDTHLMVRVGGGWDTLEHFLSRHDPCRIFQHKRAIAGSIDSLNNEDRLNYVVVQGRYKSAKH